MTDRAPRWFFEDSAHCAALLAEAESWIGTPFMPFSKAKGKFGGIDCVGLAEEIMRNVGASPEFHFPRTSADYQGHAFGDRILEYFRGTGPDPQSALVAARVVELLVIDGEPVDDPMPGDLLVLRHGELFHLPIVIDSERHFVNALPRLGVVRGTLQDSTFKSHFIAMFRVRA
jgi:hypothetical protein